MANQNAGHDDNHVPSLIALSSTDGVSTVQLWADPVSHRLLVNSTGGGSSFITSLTTTGSSGAATVVSGVLNIPIYAGGGGTPAGSNTQVQYNASGSFGANAGFTTDTSGNVTVNTLTTAATGNTIPFIKAGSAVAATNVSVGGRGVEIGGVDTSNGGMNLIVSNTASNANSFVDLFLQNDSTVTNSATNYAVVNYNSSVYSYTGYGTAIAVPNQLAVYSNNGPTLIGSGFASGYVNIVVGGMATTNEIARFTTSGFSVPSQTVLGASTAVGTSPLEVQKSAIGTTVADSNGLTLANTTAATSSVQQNSPSLHFKSQGWATTPVASQSTDWILYQTPVSGAANPTANFFIANAVNGGAYTTRLTVGPTGSINANLFGAATLLQVTRGSLGTTSLDGILLTNGSSSTVGTPVQMSSRVNWSGTVYDTTASASRVPSFITENFPTSGATPTAVLRTGYSYNAGAYSYIMTLSSTGGLTLGAAGASTGTLALSGVTSGTTTLTPASTATGTLTLPSATDTLVARATTDTLSNKRITKRVLALSANSATPAINTDNYDVVHITAQTAAITSFTTNLTGTPVDGDTLRISITGSSGAAIAWGTSFESSTVTLPTAFTTSRQDVGFFWNTETSKWRCVAVA
jgi:hypothetical protein